MVPSDNAEEGAVGEIIASFGISGRLAELGFSGVALEQRSDHQGNAVDFLSAVGALRVGIKVNGFDLGERCAVQREESFEHHLQLGSELSREGTCELAAAETGDGQQGLLALDGGAVVHMLEDRQQASFVKAVIAFAIESAIRQRHQFDASQIVSQAFPCGRAACLQPSEIFHQADAGFVGNDEGVGHGRVRPYRSAGDIPIPDAAEIGG